MYVLFCIYCIHRASWHSSATLTEGFPCFSSFVRQMLGYNSQRRGTARTLLKLIVLFCILFVCKCVMYFCHWVILHFTSILPSQHLHIISRNLPSYIFQDTEKRSTGANVTSRLRASDIFLLPRVHTGTRQFIE